MADDNKKAGTYTAQSIKVMEGLEAVRKRPAMYIGSTSRSGLHHLVYEVVDNSVDEALAGYCTYITVTLHTDGSCSVLDNGRGIPTGIHPTEKISAAEVALTKLHAGGKFEKDVYKYSGGLHGVGVSVVNALSEWLELRIFQNGQIHEQWYDRGKSRAPLKVVGQTKEQGTYIRFKPDSKILTETDFNFDTLSTRLRELAFLNKGLRIVINDEENNRHHEFFFDGGIVSFIQEINKKKNPLFPEIIYFEKSDGQNILEVALQYNDSYNEQLFSFVNNINTVDGGTHVTGFKSALTKACNKKAQQLKILKEDESLSSEDVREGLVAVINLKIPDPQFEGQTKSKLGNSEIKGLVDSWVFSFLNTYFEENPSVARKILQKAELAQRAREAARKARDLTRRKNVLEAALLPGKLADCTNETPSETELFVVEGDSAGGCFCGSTKIALTDQRQLSFKELIEEHKRGIKNYCYTIGKNGSIEIGEIINPRLTKKNASVIKIKLDNDEEIICTPDHRFMLADGTYKTAQDLTKNDCLMPLYRQYSRKGKRITIEGYELVFDPGKRRWIFTHLLADNYNILHNIYSENNGPHRHHKNFNKLNNNPDNLERMPREIHLKVHQECAEKTLRRPEVIEKANAARRTPEYRSFMSKKMSSMRDTLSTRAKLQWQDEQYKQYMREKFLTFYRTNAEYREENTERLNNIQKEYWNQEENRKKQSSRTKEFFQNNPETRKILSTLATKQWENKELLAWRSEKTKEQWTDEFRNKRLKKYNETYRFSALSIFRNIYEQDGFINIERYNQIRKQTNNKNLLRYDTIIERFFEKNEAKLLEAVIHFNHRIKSITKLDQLIDVYDLEVPRTHNFALASGVFVHNSAKQARDRNNQAILPLRGKILNVEKAHLERVLSSEEIKALISAVGASIGDQCNPDNARYHKIILMTDADVDGSHIRTLLLTLFFRHMRPIIEKGYLYIAQPPLYKVKLGKKEQYIKDDTTLKKFLFEWAGESITLSINNKPITTQAWHKLLDKLAHYESLLDKTSYDFKIAPEQCHALSTLLITNTEIKAASENKNTQALISILQQTFPDSTIGFKPVQQLAESQVEESVTIQGFITFKRRAHEWEIPLEFFWSEKTKQLLSTLTDLLEFEQQPVTLSVQDKERVVEARGITNIIRALSDISKPYMSIQRYKGLGEMNPEQLWETSMDPKQRQLLQVTIDDALEADAWFSTLMGDDVEGRRTFIELNGRFVKNLDI